MPRLRTVDVWPWSGFVDHPWSERPATDAFVKSSRRVSELINQALGSVEIVNPVSSVRLFADIGQGLWEGIPEDASVHVSVLTNRPHHFEVANVRVPEEFTGLDPRDRGLVALDVLAASLTELARARGWDAAGVEALRRYTLSQGLGYRWSGPWKSSPTRRHRARCVASIEDDGFGRLTVEVQERVGHGVTRWGPYLSGSTPGFFQRVAKHARWASGSTFLIDPAARFRPPRITAVEIDITAPPPVPLPPARTLSPVDPHHPLPVLASSRHYGGDPPRPG